MFGINEKNLNPNKYSQEFHHCPFFVTLNDLSNKVCIPKEAEDVNLSMLNMITGISGSKVLTKDISCECKYKFDETKHNSNQWWNNNKCRCECKKIHLCEKDYFSILL